MINKEFKLMQNSNAKLTTYVLDDGEYGRKGFCHDAIIVCPGGGYSYCSKNEGEPVALFFNRHGYHAFVLDYSCGIENPFPKALSELAKAIELVKNHKEEWRLTGKVHLIGFSAGGNLALSMGLFYKESYLTSELGIRSEITKVDSIMLGYPAVTLIPKREGPLPPELVELIEKGLMPDFRGPSIREILKGHKNLTEEEKDSLNLLHYVNKDLPQLFIFGSYEDTVIPASDLTKLATLCYENGVSCELHLSAHGNHGVSICDETVKSEEELGRTNMRLWTSMVIEWLKEQQ